MDELYAALGRKQMALELAEANYFKALQCMAAMLTGEIDPTRVLVNLTERSFHWVGPGERPATPPTINGLPQVFVGQSRSEVEIPAGAIPVPQNGIEASPVPEGAAG